MPPEDKTLLLIEEWKEIRSTLKYFGNMRFAQLTVFMGVTGFLMNSVVNTDKFGHVLLIKFAGIYVAAIFALMEKRHKNYWDNFAARGREIEEELKYIRLIRYHRPKDGLFSTSITGTFLMYAIYIGSILVWVII